MNAVKDQEINYLESTIIIDIKDKLNKDELDVNEEDLNDQDKKENDGNDEENI